MWSPVLQIWQRDHWPEETKNAQARAETWVKRFDAVLNMDLPFNKVGIAHLTCTLIAPTHEEYLQVLQMLPDSRLADVFQTIARLGAGIELNSYDMMFSPEEADIVLRMYRIAKEQGCKFFMGSDAHGPKALDRAKDIFEHAIDLLELTEEDKFHIGQ